MKVFYIRCSTEEQNEARQMKQAEEAHADKIFIDKQSGKNADRKQLKEMLNYVREDDIVYCSDISRIARNTKDLLNIIEELNNKSVGFVSLKEAIDTTTPQGKFMLTVFGAIAELERESILQRQREGIAIAKQKGVYSKERCKKISLTQQEELKNDIKNKVRVCEILKKYGITKPTYYRYKENFGL